VHGIIKEGQFADILEIEAGRTGWVKRHPDEAHGKLERMPIIR